MHEPGVTLIRERVDGPGVEGVLFVNGRRVCDTLEPAWRDNEPGASCVPEGVYRMVPEYSPAFRRELWELKGVPGRSEIKIHRGNTPADSRGCILVGERDRGAGEPALLPGSSGPALERLHALLQGAQACWITIRKEVRHDRTAR